MYLFGEKNKTGKPLSPLLPETLSFELRHRPKNHKDFKDLLKKISKPSNYIKRPQKRPR